MNYSLWWHMSLWNKGGRGEQGVLWRDSQVTKNICKELILRGYEITIKVDRKDLLYSPFDCPPVCTLPCSLFNQDGMYCWDPNPQINVLTLLGRKVFLDTCPCVLYVHTYIHTNSHTDTHILHVHATMRRGQAQEHNIIIIPRKTMLYKHRQFRGWRQRDSAATTILSTAQVHPLLEEVAARWWATLQ